MRPRTGCCWTGLVGSRFTNDAGDMIRHVLPRTSPAQIGRKLVGGQCLKYFHARFTRSEMLFDIS
ncbi:MAG: hypothetical protein HY000_36455 [Planctomycetes bacterium]|nr:hypothetical protein [Planctomycetota bacterium]